jgi:hypothetical protein
MTFEPEDFDETHTRHIFARQQESSMDTIESDYVDLFKVG